MKKVLMSSDDIFVSLGILERVFLGGIIMCDGIEFIMSYVLARLFSVWFLKFV